MNLLEVLILSVVEGISEFLPISSTGHLVLAAKLLSIQQTEFVKSFEIAIQLGAILSIVFLYFKTVLGNRAMWSRVLAAFIPSAVVGLLLYTFIKGVLIGNAMVTLAALFVGGIIMIVIELLFTEKEHSISDIGKITHKRAFVVGLFQSLSVVPGVSRAAATIIGSLLVGTSRKTAVEFSFLLAVPTMFAATALDLIKSSYTFSQYEYLLLGAGFVCSFFVALVTVKYFLHYIQRHTFIAFGVYRIIVAILFFIFIL